MGDFQICISVPLRKNRNNKKKYFNVTVTAWKVSIFGVFLVHDLPHSHWMRRDTSYLSVFTLNAGKEGPEKLRIWKLFTQCVVVGFFICLTLLLLVSYFWNLYSGSQHTCSFSKHFVLFYRCFITLISTRIFDRNFETFCSCNFISCVLKSESILIYLLIDWSWGFKFAYILKLSTYILTLFP